VASRRPLGLVRRRILLLLTTASLPRALLVIPILWAAIGGSSAGLLGITADFPLIVAVLLLIVRAFLGLAGLPRSGMAAARPT
jgi:hypothetical protein